jgi:hypothetical protein
MIATEAGAEGINLQFCSLVINYDLPWNPQRIEQRIGRCHRYGQKHDVVVINFLNCDNEADRRVFELLDQKFRLFDGVFGASDEVLGAIESGVDFERRIAGIYQSCRHPGEIHAAFEQLQLDLAGEINDAMLQARQSLLENFDEQVQERLRVARADATQALDRMERLLMRLTRSMLAEYASFDKQGNGFTLHTLPRQFLAGPGQGSNAGSEPAPTIALGRYELPRVSADAHVYRLQHPLAQAIVAAAGTAPLVRATLLLDYAAYGARVSVLESLRGASGVCAVRHLRVSALGSTEEFLLLAATCNDGILDAEVTDRLLAVPGTLQPLPRMSGTERPLASTPGTGMTPTAQVSLDFAAAQIPLPAILATELGRQRSAVVSSLEERNLRLFSAETEKLDAWADDQRTALEQQLNELQRRIKEARTRGKAAATLADKLAAQHEQRDLEILRDRQRRALFARQDEIQARRDALIEEVERQLAQQVDESSLMLCEWVLA